METSGISALESARKDIAAWRAEQTTNCANEPHFRYLIQTALRDNLPRLNAFGEVMTAFGTTVATEMRPLADVYCRTENEPRLRRTNADGTIVNEVVLHPLQKEAGRLIWKTGIVEMAKDTRCSYEQAAFLYLFSHLGEIGQACQYVCTIGALRTIRRNGDSQLRHAFMSLLGETDYDRAYIASQFVTEQHGGSDVGANEAYAVSHGDGSWHIFGHKFFCSVAHADVFLVTARPREAKEGRGGLALFAVPRYIDGAINNFEIVRLKPKIGTTALPTGEFEFKGALAFPVGKPEDGFKTLMNDVIDTSRFLNSVANAGLMRAAYLEALLWAKRRSAFGHKLIDFPDVRAQLAEMKAEWLSALYSGFLLAGLDEKKDCGTLHDDDAVLYRFLVNANKYTAARQCTKVVHMATRLLGGNGAVEDFSILPRLFGDSIVYELWEGGENVLAKQVMKDTLKNGVDELCVTVSCMTSRLAHVSFDLTKAAMEALNFMRDILFRSAVDPSTFGALHFARNMERLVWLIQATQMAAHCPAADAPLGKELKSAAQWIVRTKLSREYRPEDDAYYFRLIDDILGTDLAR